MVTIFSSSQEISWEFTGLIQQIPGDVLNLDYYTLQRGGFNMSLLWRKMKLIFTDSMFVKVRPVPKKGECGPRVDFNL